MHICICDIHKKKSMTKATRPLEMRKMSAHLLYFQGSNVQYAYRNTKKHEKNMIYIYVYVYIHMRQTLRDARNGCTSTILSGKQRAIYTSSHNETLFFWTYICIYTYLYASDLERCEKRVQVCCGIREAMCDICIVIQKGHFDRKCERV